MTAESTPAQLMPHEGERLIALVGPDGNGPAVVRAAHKLAQSIDAPWVAVTVETPAQSLRAARDVNEALALAQHLGGRNERIIDSNLPDAILRYARKNDVTQILVGRSRANWLRRAIGRSL